jgi:amidase
VAARRTGRRPGAAVLEETTLALAAAGNALSSADLVASIEIIHAAARDLGGFFERYDVLVTPTVAQPPPLVGALQPRTWERLALRLAAATRSRALTDRLFAQVGDRSFDATGFTMPFNQTGQPAMSVPLHVSASGLPIGVQVVGRFGDEATLFRLASQLEAARPWADRMPPGVASGR